ncbi:GPI-anchor biosynthesis protein-like protein [Polyplosphaeria fusca]|uniref:GPI-anchor biosynthesis protein-like protein n=1 Tax=Polyplosphaeria fusca TaxID=682080 RepID=A0A9P4R0I9_9PLEO|nr:GPI-anchor biosynthesis protein-like protein [Polyplosphaeria fusca]
MKPPATPIDTLSNDAANLYKHLHPVLILSLYAYQFSSIVADPVPALTTTLIPLAVLQIAYAAICLPPIGSSNGVGGGEKKKPGERRKAAPGKLEVSFNSKIVPAFLSLISSTLPGIPVLALSLLLFGAPVTTHHAETLLAAAHISFLATLPLVYVHGVDGGRWREIVAAQVHIDEVFGCTLGTLVGAWLGAVPIPLDWDREWQKWPITIVTGAYIGFTVGKVLGGTILKGKTVSFE